MSGSGIGPATSAAQHTTTLSLVHAGISEACSVVHVAAATVACALVVWFAYCIYTKHSLNQRRRQSLDGRDLGDEGIKIPVRFKAALK